MKTDRNDKSNADRVLFISNITVSVAVIVTAMLQLFDIWSKAINVCCPLMGVMMVLQAIREWKLHRGVAVFSLCCAAFIFICSVIVLFSSNIK